MDNQQNNNAPAQGNEALVVADIIKMADDFNDKVQKARDNGLEVTLDLFHKKINTGTSIFVKISKPIGCNKPVHY